MTVEQVSGVHGDGSVTFVARIPWNFQFDYTAFDDVIEWGREHLGHDRFKISTVDTVKGKREQTFWLMDSKAALLFKLRWVGAV